MPSDRWDAEAREALCCCDGSRERSHALYCPADNSALVACVVALARHAFREGLERAEDLARQSGIGDEVLAAAIHRETEGLG